MTIAGSEKIDSVTKMVQELLQTDHAINVDAELDSNGLDSYKMMQLVAGIEENFHIEVPDSELLYENFATIAKIIAFIEKYQ
jgi:acyl carrier protein